MDQADEIKRLKKKLEEKTKEIAALKQVKPKKVKSQQYRSTYTKEDITNAYNAVKEKGLAIHAAAKMFSVPPQTLRDRLTGVVDPNNDASGVCQLMSMEEEQTLVDHVEVMVQLGYRYTNVQLKHLGGELAHDLGKRETNKPLSKNWLYSFFKRWEDRLNSLGIRSHKTTRAKGPSPQGIDQYYSELQSILQKYGLSDKPQFIYTVSETELQPPSNGIASPNNSPQAITSPRSTTATVYGCANAIGNSLPPYFIFKGVRFTANLLKGSSPGTKATISESGLTDATIFKKYLEEHFLSFVCHSTLQPILLLYDGHASHVTPAVIEWGKQNNVNLFVLPPHTSHLLKPLDVAIFTPFNSYYNSECSLFMQQNVGQKITRNNMCEIVCKAYMNSFTPANVVAAFKKTGIFPFCKMAIAADKQFPTEVLKEKKPVKKVRATKVGKEIFIQKLKNLEKMAVENENDSSTEKVKKVKRPSPGQLAITEGDYEDRLSDCEEMRAVLPKKSKTFHTT